ncbi:MAG: PilT/PilU family type 4a pilus ATPase [Candidatus Eisenbacteria bacterium]|nr:PilT/PilU family type 4a pilus ATPase [Candidatus Eisenbacteria bacterium]
MARIDAFLEIGRQQGGSDIHFTVGLPPLVRLDGELVPVKFRNLDADEVLSFVREILSPHHEEELERRGATDFAYAAAGVGRFRVNVLRQRRGVAAICRVIPDNVPQLNDLGLPRVVHQFTSLTSGLVLVTGPTGTGKSTTLAAMIREIAETRSVNIVTLEDPVEFLHRSSRSLIIQRELGTQVASFREGLRSALRQDPDVILVGELREPEAISLALEAAETGHLVLGTLHTRGAAQTIDRIVDAHSADHQAQVRHSLADNLKAVVSQELIRAADGRGRRAALEVLVITTAVQQMVREGKTFQIPGAITTGKRLGMQLMDQAMLQLVRAGEIDPDEAFLRAEDKWGFAPFLTRPELLAMTTGDRVA